MKKYCTTMKVKVFLVFTSLMIVSIFFSFLIMQTIGKKIVQDELTENQQGVANTFINIKDETNLSLESIIPLIDNPSYQFLYFNEDEMDLLKERLLKGVIEEHQSLILADLENSENTMRTVITEKGFLPRTVIKNQEEYLLILMDEQIVVNTIVHRPIGISLLIAAGIGFVLMLVGARQLAKPVQKLSNGLNQVANGNFDIELPEKGHDEISLISIQFNKMVKELRAIVYLRRDFMNNICHELKTPLASIQGFAKLLQYDELTTQQRVEYTQIISEEAERLSKLTVNILNLSKLDNQLILEEVETFNLAEEVRKVFLMLEPLWLEKELHFDLELDEVEIAGCRELIVQVLLNLLSNAIKFSTYQGALDVSLVKNQQQVLLMIKDNGHGMSLETQQRLFEPFYQGDTAHNEAGHGLGMSIVKRIVTLHHGTISVESEEGIGTCILVELPIEQ
ncbi:MAG TPA: two-component sensor histidine kinase [Firmicutes bacterium]|nr:two-component sensor histidine kinase [Bacillota bacterium]